MLKPKYELVNDHQFQISGTTPPWKCPLHGIFRVGPLSVHKELICPSCQVLALEFCEYLTKSFREVMDEWPEWEAKFQKLFGSEELKLFSEEMFNSAKK